MALKWQLFDMEAVKRIGVLIAGIGSVGDAFVRVLEQRFQSADARVRVVAIGDSKGFLCAVTATTKEFDWDDVHGILAHKKSGQPIRSWTNTTVSATAFDELSSVLQHVFVGKAHDDYILVDCTSSATITPALIQAKQLGLAVVMANKLPVSGPLHLYKELVGDVSARSSRVRYEATAGAGLPVVNVIQRLVASKDCIKQIQGGLSGTMTNIMAAMNSGMPFSAGLREVHQLGITEADPREDLSGTDVARKMVILAREIGIDVEVSDVEITPLLPSAAFELPIDKFLASLHEYDQVFSERWQAARSSNSSLAYLGTITADGRIEIGLQLVPTSSLFATASSTEGVVSISSEWFPEPLLMRGTGAGAQSTAAAIAGDVAAIIAACSK